jgi:hypothetical protein
MLVALWRRSSLLTLVLYQAYQQLRAQSQLAQENLQTAEMYQDAAMQWGAWGGWELAGDEWVMG